VRAKVKLDEMQIGFGSGKSNLDAIFIVQQLHEKYLDEFSSVVNTMDENHHKLKGSVL